MNRPLRRVVNFFRYKSPSDRELIKRISRIVGKKPINLAVYQLAFQHKSIAEENIGGIKESNERLEFLGDAILGSVVASYLFRKFPYRDEGFLTEIRSRIVNRESLNDLSKKLGLGRIVRFDGRPSAGSHAYKSLHGDTLEALVGAVYLDKGYQAASKFIIKKLLCHYDLHEVINTNPNHKSKVIEWAHRNKKEIRFEIVQSKNSKSQRQFTAEVYINDKPVGKGMGFSKKKAEQEAAMRSCEALMLE